MSQAVRFCLNNNGYAAHAYVARDISTGWFNMEKRRQPPGPIPILDPQAGTIAGVKIHSLQEVITDGKIRGEIQKALEEISFHIKFKKKDFDEEKKKRKFCALSPNEMRHHYANYLLLATTHQH